MTMSDLIDEANTLLARNQWASGWGVESLAERLTDALEAAEAERDAALARIAELEAELEVAMRPHSECERSGAEAGERIVDLEGDLAGAEARIAEAAKLHYEEDHECVECSFESMPDVGFRGVSVPWPCPTAVSLGLNEGEGDDY